MHETLNIPFVDNSKFQPLCQAYREILTYWNSITNIVSSTNVDKLLTELIRQSVAPLALLDVPQRAKILDIGSGAGIPALPLKFARPDLQVIMLEPRRKKYLFLKRVMEDLALQGVEVVRARLEEVHQTSQWQREFDLVTTRATGPAAHLFPMARPLVRSGGMCWFFKGRAARREYVELAAMTKHDVRLLELEKNLSLLVVQF